MFKLQFQQSKTKGWERLFEEYLKCNGELYLFKKFAEFRNIFKHAELICPRCKEIYDLGNCRCGANLNIEYNKNPYIECPDCGEIYSSKQRHCEDENHTSSLKYFLIGNERTLLRTFGLLLFSSPEELRSTGFYQKTADISNVLDPLHYLEDKTKAIRKIVFPEYNFYLWKIQPKGEKICKNMLNIIDNSFGFRKYLLEFVDERINKTLKEEEVLIYKEFIQGTALISKGEKNEIEGVQRQRNIIHVKGSILGE